MRIIMNEVRFQSLVVVSLAVLVLPGCQPFSVSSGPPNILWTKITESIGGLPAAVSVFEGIDEQTPLRAWYARIDLADSSVSANVMFSDDSDGKETTSEMARDTGACLAVNGGYFVSGDNGARHIGLLLSDQEMIRRATNGIFVDEIRYPTARAAIGFLESGVVQIAWVTTSGDSVLAWTAPPQNLPGSPGSVQNQTDAILWDVQDAMAAGPSLVRNGAISITADEEIFFNTPIPNVHPRTAAGIDMNGNLILLVVDGRQNGSRGVNLPDLASILIDLGSEIALNLDGGGSSAFVVNGRLLNRPEGDIVEREVVSGLSILCHDNR